jgi:hypothetical protein
VRETKFGDEMDRVQKQNKFCCADEKNFPPKFFNMKNIYLCLFARNDRNRFKNKTKKKETKILTDFIWLTTVCARPRIFFVFSPFRLTPLIPYDSRTDEELRRPTCSFYTGQPKQKQNKKKRKEMCVLK